MRTFFYFIINIKQKVVEYIKFLKVNFKQQGVIQKVRTKNE